MQALGFLTPLEIEHTLIQSWGDEAEIGTALVAQGYQANEVRRAMEHTTRYGIIRKNRTKLSLRDDRRETVRQHLLLDVLCIHGRDIQPGTTASVASVLVSGHGPFFGMEMDKLANVAIAKAGQLGEEISHSQTFAADIKALSQRGHCLVGR